jgi:hypothetical protein
MNQPPMDPSQMDPRMLAMILQMMQQQGGQPGMPPQGMEQPMPPQGMQGATQGMPQGVPMPMPRPPGR